MGVQKMMLAEEKEVVDCELCGDADISRKIKPVIVNGLVLYYSSISENWDYYQLFNSDGGLICTIPKSSILEFGGF